MKYDFYQAIVSTQWYYVEVTDFNGSLILKQIKWEFDLSGQTSRNIFLTKLKYKFWKQIV